MKSKFVKMPLNSVILFFIAFSSLAKPAEKICPESWFGLYIGETKVGYSNMLIRQIGDRKPQGYLLDSTTITKLTVLDTTVEQKIKYSEQLNAQFYPTKLNFEATSLGHATKVFAKFSKAKIECKVISAGVGTQQTIPIPKGVSLVSDTSLALQNKPLKVGDKFKFHYFNPLSLAIESITMEILSKDKIELGGEIREVFVVKNITSVGTLTSWVDEKGSLLKMQGMLGITMVKEPKEIALNIASQPYKPLNDLIALATIKTDKEITDPRNIRYLKMKITGIEDESLIISDERQKASPQDSAVIYEIEAKPFSATESISIPIKSKGFEPYLAHDPYIQANNKAILKTARAIIGEQRNAWQAASRLRNWVFTNMKPDAKIGVPRTSLDILQGKTGVCRDYAILYAALARAVGLPTKLVGGIVYWKNGFYWHIWAESYVGEWIAIDPTRPPGVVDATYVKFVEGNISKIFPMAKLLGKLEAEIIEFRS